MTLFQINGLVTIHNSSPNDHGDGDAAASSRAWLWLLKRRKDLNVCLRGRVADTMAPQQSPSAARDTKRHPWGWWSRRDGGQTDRRTRGEVLGTQQPEQANRSSPWARQGFPPPPRVAWVTGPDANSDPELTRFRAAAGHIYWNVSHPGTCPFLPLSFYGGYERSWHDRRTENRPSVSTESPKRPGGEFVKGVVAELKPKQGFDLLSALSWDKF